MSFAYLDSLALRIVPLPYTAPAICQFEFSSTGSQTVVLNPLEFRKGPTGLSVNRLASSLRLAWNAVQGAICYTVYKLEDPENPLSPYVVVAQCIQAGLTPDGETASSETFSIGPDCEAIVYWNKEQIFTATCASGTVGTPATYLVSAKTFGAKTQAEADAKALEYAKAQAALQLTCRPAYCYGNNCDGGTGGVFAPIIGDLPDAFCVGEEVYALLDVSRGREPLGVSYSGELPPGLVFDADTLELYGTVTGAGYFEFTVTVVDSTVPTNQVSTRVFGMFVDAFVTDENLPTAAVGNEYSVELEVSGLTAPVKWVVTEGTLPDGLVLDETTGIISGTPTVLGQVASFTVEATLID